MSSILRPVVQLPRIIFLVHDSFVNRFDLSNHEIEFRYYIKNVVFDYLSDEGRTAEILGNVELAAAMNHWEN